MTKFHLLMLRSLNSQNDIAQKVSQRKCKNALGQMFTVETALIKKNIGRVV